MFTEIAGVALDFLKAFAVGGLICMIAQVVINFTDLTAGKILVTFMLIGVALQGLGLYQILVDLQAQVQPFRLADLDTCLPRVRCRARKEAGLAR